MLRTRRNNAGVADEAAIKGRDKGGNRMKPGILAGAVLATVMAGAALAQSRAAIKLADVAELYGGGATVGTNWKNGIDLAIE